MPPPLTLLPVSPLQIKIWNIPKQLLTRNLTTYRKELIGHARRVGLVEWHPTTANILFSAGYDYKVSLRLLYTGNHTLALLEASLRVCRLERLRQGVGSLPIPQAWGSAFHNPLSPWSLPLLHSLVPPRVLASSPCLIEKPPSFVVTS